MGNLNESLGLIRKGILENDMKIVSSGFKLLTGEELSAEPVSKNTPVPKPAPQKREDISDFIASSKKTGEDKFQTKEPIHIGERPNLFEDDGNAIEEAGAELLNDQIDPTPRDRPHANKVSVTCEACNKTEQVPPVLHRDRYICNKCIGKRK